MIKRIVKKKLKLKSKFTATILDSNGIISTVQAIHHQSTPDQEIDLHELQLTKLDPDWLIHPEIQGHVPCLLHLLLH